MDWQALLDKLKVRDEVESEESQYFIAFRGLSRRGGPNEAGKLHSEIESLVTQLNQSTLKTQALQKDIQDRDASIESLESSTKRLQAKIASLNAELEEKNRAVDVANDEVLTLQIQLNVMGEKMKSVEKENASLVARWMERMKKEADEMNMLNEGGIEMVDFSRS